MNISEDRIAEVLSDIKITNEDHKNKLLRKIELMPVELTYEELANVAGGEYLFRSLNCSKIR